MKTLCHFLLILFSFTLTACPFGTWRDNSTESSWLTGYEITYSPQKEVYSLNDEIKIKLKYDKVAKYYHNLTIKLSGGNYISEDSYVESDSNISIHTSDSDKNLLNKIWNFDFEPYLEKKLEQTLILTVNEAGKYTIGVSLEGRNRTSEVYDIAYESYTFSFK